MFPRLSLPRSSLASAQDTRFVEALKNLRHTGVRVFGLQIRVKRFLGIYIILDISGNQQRTMELGDGKRDIVDPEVRAYVSSLVTAVSGIYIPG